jgi:hypothetical protein
MHRGSLFLIMKAACFATKNRHEKRGSFIVIRNFPIKQVAQAIFVDIFLVFITSTLICYVYIDIVMIFERLVLEDLF